MKYIVLHLGTATVGFGYSRSLKTGSVHRHVVCWGYNIKKLADTKYL